MNFGVSSMVSPLRKVALMKPSNALLNANPNKWNYSDKFDPRKIETIFENFLTLLRNDNIEIFWMDGSKTDIADAIFTYDASLITPSGAVLMSPGKTLRVGEQNIHRKFYINNDIPIIGEIKGNGIAEAGDTLWLDSKTLIIGKGFRTNEDGASQIKEIMDKIGIKVHSCGLFVTRYTGEGAPCSKGTTNIQVKALLFPSAARGIGRPLPRRSAPPTHLISARQPSTPRESSPHGPRPR